MTKKIKKVEIKKSETPKETKEKKSSNDKPDKLTSAESAKSEKKNKQMNDYLFLMSIITGNIIGLLPVKSSINGFKFFALRNLENVMIVKPSKLKDQIKKIISNYK